MGVALDGCALSVEGTALGRASCTAAPAASSTYTLSARCSERGLLALPIQAIIFACSLQSHSGAARLATILYLGGTTSALPQTTHRMCRRHAQATSAGQGTNNGHAAIPVVYGAARSYGGTVVVQGSHGAVSQRSFGALPTLSLAL